MDGGQLPPVVLLHWAVAWEAWMGPDVPSVHPVLTQEGHLQQRIGGQGMMQRVLPQTRSESQPTGIQGSRRLCKDNVGPSHSAVQAPSQTTWKREDRE